MRAIYITLLSFVFASLLTTGCSNDPAITSGTPADSLSKKDTLNLTDTIVSNGIRVIITPITYEAYAKDSARSWKNAPDEESPLLEEDSLLVTFKDSVYTILLNNGKTHTLKDHTNTDSDDYTSYTYSGMTKARDYFIFDVGLYEGGMYLLVDAENGKEIDLWQYPFPSPNGKWMLAFSYDMEAGFMPNGFQVIKKAGGELKTLDHAPERWGVPEGFWVSGNTAYIVQQVPVYSADNFRYDRYYARVEVTEENGK
jgi:hypothetical protein